jgi:hypothetical protein
MNVYNRRVFGKGGGGHSKKKSNYVNQKRISQKQNFNRTQLHIPRPEPTDKTEREEAKPRPRQEKTRKNCRQRQESLSKRESKLLTDSDRGDINPEGIFSFSGRKSGRRAQVSQNFVRMKNK